MKLLIALLALAPMFADAAVLAHHTAGSTRLAGASDISASRIQIAQTFVADQSGEVSGVKLLLSGEAGRKRPYAFFVEIWSQVGGVPGSLLVSAQGTAPLLSNDSPSWVTTTFTPGVSLVAGTAYAVVLRTVDGTLVAWGSYLNAAPVDRYPDGRVYSDYPGSWVARIEDVDLAFEIWSGDLAAGGGTSALLAHHTPASSLRLSFAYDTPASTGRVAQTFVADLGGEVSGVKLRLSADEEHKLPDVYFVEIWSQDGGGAPGALLASAQGTTPTLSIGSPTWVTTTFSAGLSLVSGTGYAVALRAVDGVLHAWGSYLNDSNRYAYGRQFSDYPGYWRARIEDVDLSFEVLSGDLPPDGGAPPVPLPDPPDFVTAAIDRTTAILQDSAADNLNLSFRSSLALCSLTSTPNITAQGPVYPEYESANPADPKFVLDPAESGNYSAVVTCTNQTGTKVATSTPVTFTVLPAHAATATLKTSSATLLQHTNVTVTWSSANASRCVGTGSMPISTGNWEGSVLAPTGSLEIKPIASGEFVIGVRCVSIDPKQEALPGTAQVTVRVTSSAVAVSSSAVNVVHGQSFAVSWEAAPPASCTASGGGANGSSWSGSLAPSGSITQTAIVTGSFSYEVDCGPLRSSRVNVVVSAPTPSPPATGGGNSTGGDGGGGSTDLWIMLMLAAASLMKLRRGLAFTSGMSAARTTSTTPG